MTTTNDAGHRRAAQPEDLSRFFVDRLNAGDLDGLVALYEPDAVLAFPAGRFTKGATSIRRAYEQLLADKPTVVHGEQRPALRSGDLALTSTLLPDGGVTAEVARRQPDGTWLWVLDQSNLLDMPR